MYKLIPSDKRGERWMLDGRMVKADTVPEDIKESLRQLEAARNTPENEIVKQEVEVNRSAEQPETEKKPEKCGYGHKMQGKGCVYQYCPYFVRYN